MATIGELTRYRYREMHMVKLDRVETFCERLGALLRSDAPLDKISQKLDGYFDGPARDGKGRPSGDELRRYIEVLVEEGFGVRVHLNRDWATYKQRHPVKIERPLVSTETSAEPTDQETVELAGMYERERDEFRVRAETAEKALEICMGVAKQNKQRALDAENQLKQARERVRVLELQNHKPDAKRARKKGDEFVDAMRKLINDGEGELAIAVARAAAK